MVFEGVNQRAFDPNLCEFWTTSRWKLDNGITSRPALDLYLVPFDGNLGDLFNKINYNSAVHTIATVS